MSDDTRRKILWADDEIDLLRPHIKYLEQRGFAVTAVPNGEDALAALAQSRFDVVLLDEMMPGLGGLATLDAIKSRDVSVPVIPVTKSEEETLMEEAIGRHIRDYLIKPVHPSQVLLALKRVLESDRIQEVARTRDYVSEMQRWQGLDRRGFGWNDWVELAVEMARWDVRWAGAGQGLARPRCDLRGPAGRRRRVRSTDLRTWSIRRGSGRLKIAAAAPVERGRRPCRGPAPQARRARGVDRDRLPAPRPVAHAGAVARGALRDPSRALLFDPADRHAVLA
jgi:CheY-like chemotaxis protein